MRKAKKARPAPRLGKCDAPGCHAGWEFSNVRRDGVSKFCREHRQPKAAT